MQQGGVSSGVFALLIAAVAAVNTAPIPVAAENDPGEGAQVSAAVHYDSSAPLSSIPPRHNVTVVAADSVLRLPARPAGGVSTHRRNRAPNFRLRATE